MSARVPGHCGVHHGWAYDTAPFGDDHGSGGAGTSRIWLPCGRKHVARGGASDTFKRLVVAMAQRASQNM